MSTTARGAIRNEQAYIQGKVLDHSGWSKVLPRKITPSDVDLFFDNRGKCILGELSRHHDNWRKIAYGQWKGYQSLIEGTEHVAALLKHGVGSKFKIDTMCDVEHWQLMLWDKERRCFGYSPIFGGDAWIRFVVLWHDEDKPGEAWRKALESTRSQFQ